MSKTKLYAAAAGIALVLGAAYFAVSKLPQNAGGGDTSAAQDVSSEPIFAASFKDFDDKLQPLKQWRGKVLVLNFWAPWCPPCRAEIPGFIELQNRYRERGLVFVGLALDEKINVQAFADELGINYPVLLGEMEGVDLARKAGNRLGGLPFTVVIDRNGKIVGSELGGVSSERLEKIVAPLL